MGMFGVIATLFGFISFAIFMIVGLFMYFVEINKPEDVRRPAGWAILFVVSMGLFEICLLIMQLGEIIRATNG